jgi:hypothetical protein
MAMPCETREGFLRRRPRSHFAGTIYLIDRDHVTTDNQHYCPGCSSDPEIVQEILHAGVSEWLFSTPAYWNSTVYFCGTNDVLKAYTLSNGLLGKSPSSSSTNSFGFAGATPSISANGNTNGIVWAIDSRQFSYPGPAFLHAYDATNVAKELWNSSQAANHRDQAGNAVKFTVPTIFNGKVYIGTSSELDVYGLLPSHDDLALTGNFSNRAEKSLWPVSMLFSGSAQRSYFPLSGIRAWHRPSPRQLSGVLPAN